jgi:dTDP-4-amino-4,6-dideoxygalactose transaminase
MKTIGGYFELELRRSREYYQKAIGNQPVMKMSVLTESLLRNIDYNAVREKRTGNFKILHEHLRGKNKIQIPVVEPIPALAYPFLPERKGLRQHLRKHNILIPVYWPNVLKRVKSETTEYKFADEIIALPVDQRYSLKDMNRIINTVLNYV